MTVKTARHCDSCARRPAKWYCAADDAFLCCGCDASVHSVSPLALRHHRLQLRGVRPTSNLSDDDAPCPPWLRGFTRKARTPRPRGRPPAPSSVVPEIDTSDENTGEEVEQEALLYRVPVFDPEPPEESSSDCLVGFLPSSAELEEFNADIERLLAPGVDNSAFSIEEMMYDDIKAEAQQQLRKVGLRLDYEAVISEWLVQGSSSSPWMDGERPQLGPDDCWLDYMGMWGGGDQILGQVQAEAGGGNVDEEREARVSRYREKRRTRLFSKKIRYEVRKLNAEKRPRMKGRFVKRAS